MSGAGGSVAISVGVFCRLFNHFECGILGEWAGICGGFLGGFSVSGAGFWVSGMGALEGF